MNRAELWIRNNNIKDNCENIKLIFKSFGLEEKKDFWIKDDCVKFRKFWKNCERIYKVTVDEEHCTLLIHLRDIKLDKDRNETFHVFRKKDGEPYLFNGFDPWVACVKFLIR